MIQSFKGMIPVVHPSAYVHPQASVIGHVTIGPDCYIGPGAVLRGDWGRIILKAGCNVQENCVVHMFPGTTVHLAEGALQRPLADIGMLNPDVATLRFRWEIDGQEYTKDKGGFFVGVSPEFLLLIGVVGVFENILHDREPRPHWFDREDMRSAIINGRSYKIATHRETPAKTRPNSGFHLRSYWPMYVFTASSRDERYSGEQPVERPQPGHSGTTIAAREAEISVGPVLLSELLPNPRTEGDSDEWVRFQNNTNTLWTGEGWKLKIGNEVSSLDGTVEIPAGFDGSLEVRKLNPPLALSNRGGTVTLLDPTGNVACQVSYPKVPALFEDVIFRFVPAG